MKNKFTEEDYSKVIDFLNFIAEKAVFQNWKTEDSVKHFKLLAHMQQTILPKIKENICEITKINNPKKDVKENDKIDNTSNVIEK